MGKLIMCSSPLAKNPYHFRVTGTNVYSMEEVCFYIKSNIYIMQEEIFDREFAQWIRGELGMSATADKLDKLILDHNNLKDIVVTLCCSCDYFDEPQINQLIRVMDETEHLPLRGRKKIKADNYLRSGSYEKALEEYGQILTGDDMLEATAEEYGNLCHNMGVCLACLGSYSSASDHFRQAYEKSGAFESKKAYLFSMKFCGQEEYESALLSLKMSEEERQVLDEEYTRLLLEGEESKNVKRVAKLQLLAKDGRLKEYYDKVGMYLQSWKEEYRSQIRV